MSFVRLVSPLDLTSAQTLLSALKGHGIAAFMDNEHLAQTAPYLRLAVGGFPIYVPEDRLKDAEDVMALLGSATLLPAAAGEDDGGLSCPQCGGDGHPRRNWLLTLLTNAGVTLTGFAVTGRRRWCGSCGHRWKPDEVQAFTEDELGYDPSEPVFDFRAFLAWTRSIGYERSDESQTGETSHEPDRRL
jgi:hypothetical protein